MIKSYREPANFKEPILKLIRRTQKVEYYEGITQGIWEFIHSDGTTRKMIIGPQSKLVFPAGTKTYVGYIRHEDHPSDPFQHPRITGEEFTSVMRKTISDKQQWDEKAKHVKATGTMWMNIFIGIGALVFLICVGLMLIPPTFWERGGGEAPAVAEAVKGAATAAMNATKKVTYVK